QLDAAMAAVPPNARRIAVAHALTYGGQTSGSERPLTLGGTGAVDAARFDGFCYAALGHLHRPQQITGTGCRYSGSLMKYSFDEADHAKSVSVVDIDGQGNASVMAIPLTPRRDVRRLRGSLQEIVEGARRDPARDDYISITLVDAPAVWDALARLREHYPNVMHLEFEFTSAEDQAPKLAGAGADWSQRSLVQLFRDFYQQTTGAPIEERHMKAFLDAAERVASDEKEVAAS
ncbi:MAG: exonuclease SbcCD subunit D C-terminal domain-containing protein, partial [Bacillota bacterium]